jgi:hypothetical protein
VAAGGLDQADGGGGGLGRAEDQLGLDAGGQHEQLGGQVDEHQQADQQAGHPGRGAGDPDGAQDGAAGPAEDAGQGHRQPEQQARC